MKVYLLLLSVALLTVLVGCSGPAPNPPAADVAKPSAGPVDEEGEIRANLEQLSPEDRKIAEAQKVCPIMPKKVLGQMGKPYKVMLNDQPVFLCCKGCVKKAQADPEKTLAKVQALKAAGKDKPSAQ
jgi:hypothetical protein